MARGSVSANTDGNGTVNVKESIGSQAQAAEFVRRASRIVNWVTVVAIALTLAAVVYAYVELLQLQDRKVVLETQVAQLNTKIADQTQQISALGEEVKKRIAVGAFVKEGVDFFAGERYTDAARTFDRAIERDPLNPLLLNLKGYALLRGKEPIAAIGSFERSLKIEPEQLWPRLDLANALWLGGQRENAISEFKVILDKHPNMYVVLKQDARFSALRTSKEFAVLIQKYSEVQ